MYWPYDVGLFMYDSRPENAAEMSTAMSRAVLRQDAEAARALFDHAFWNNIDFKPDWFHLYAAVDQGSRVLTKMMVTYGARLDDAQMTVLCQAMPEKAAAIKHILAEGGMRVDLAMKRPLDPLAAIQMDRRILSENLKSAPAGGEDAAHFNNNVSELTLRAAMKGEHARAREIFTNHTEQHKGIDTTALLRERIKAAPLGMNATDILYMVDALKTSGIAMRPVDVDKLPENTGDIYDLIPALKQRGLLGGQASAMREKLVRAMCFMQEDINISGYQMSMQADTVSKNRAVFTKAAAALCTRDADITPHEARTFVGIHGANAGRLPDATRYMDETLIKSGYFENPAFDADALKALGAVAPGDDLRTHFNKQAQKIMIEKNGVPHYLHRKRFDELLGAIESKAFVPDAVATVQILDFINSRQPRGGVTTDAKRALGVLKNAGADFSAVNPIDLLGRQHPLLAKELLNMDIIPVKDISYYDLKSKIPPHKGMRAMFAEPSDKQYALREFLYQVMYERDYPEKAAAARQRNNACYQKLFTHETIMKQMDTLKDIARKKQAAAFGYPSGKPGNPYKKYRGGRSGPKPWY